MNFEEDMISQYFFLNKKIEATKKRIKSYKSNFWNQSLYTRTEERDGKLITTAANIENEVINYISGTEQAIKRTLILEFKEKNFQTYLKKLAPSDRIYLIQRYRYNEIVTNEKLDAKVMDEISEIETAVYFRFGLTQIDIKEELENKFDESEESIQEQLKKMMELMDVG